MCTTGTHQLVTSTPEEATAYALMVAKKKRQCYDRGILSWGECIAAICCELECQFEYAEYLIAAVHSS